MSGTTFKASLAVSTPEIGGVRIRRHPLDREASKLATLARRVRIRLERWMEETEALCDDDGRSVLPNFDMNATLNWYLKAVLGLLNEQRARAVLKDGKPPLSDVEFEAELRQLAEETLLRMSPEDFARLLATRPVDVKPTEHEDLMSEANGDVETAASPLDAAPIPVGPPLDTGTSMPFDFGGDE